MGMDVPVQPFGLFSPNGKKQKPQKIRHLVTTLSNVRIDPALSPKDFEWSRPWSGLQRDSFPMTLGDTLEVLVKISPVRPICGRWGSSWDRNWDCQRVGGNVVQTGSTHVRVWSCSPHFEHVLVTAREQVVQPSAGGRMRTGNGDDWIVTVQGPSAKTVVGWSLRGKQSDNQSTWNSRTGRQA
jgi:hypothetical protein